MEEKECRKCNIVKPLEDFYKKKDRKSGLSSQCKLCIRTYHNAYTKGYLKKAYDMTPEEKEKQRIKNKKAYLRRTYGVSKEEINRFLKL